MNVHLTYQSGQAYSERLANFKSTISRKNPKRVTCTFREKEAGEAFLSFSLPVAKAKQLAFSILAISASEEMNPIEFAVVEESKR